jgi:hypothetical protein
MTKELYRGDLEAAYAAGGLIVTQALVQNHKKTPYDSVDVLMGDVHIALQDFWNHYAKDSKYKKLTIEQILEKEDLFSEVFK